MARQPATGGLPQRSTRLVMLFNVFINDLGQGAPSGSVQMTQNREEGLIDQMVAQSQQAGETNQQGSYEVQQWEMQVLQLWSNNPMQENRLGASQLQSSLAGKGPGGSNRHQADQEPAMRPCSKDG